MVIIFFEAGACCSGFLTGPHTTVGAKIQNMKKLRGEIIIRFKEDGSIDWFCDGNDAQLATLLNEVSKRCKELRNGVLIAGKKIHSDLAKSEYYAPKGEA